MTESDIDREDRDLALAIIREAILYLRSSATRSGLDHQYGLLTGPRRTGRLGVFGGRRRDAEQTGEAFLWSSARAYDVADLVHNMPGQLCFAWDPSGCSPGRAALVQFVRAVDQAGRVGNDALVEWAEHALEGRGGSMADLREHVARPREPAG